MGTTGEWSDRTEWSVKAFSSEGKAKAMVERLAAWCDLHQVGENNHCSYENRYKLNKPEDDPDFICDYTGTKYYYFAVPFEE